MRPLQARLVTLCQQVLALGVVLVVLTPASGVVSLDIVGGHPGEQLGRTGSGRVAPAELMSATVPTRAVTPHVTEVPLTGAAGGFKGLVGRTITGGATTGRVTSRPQSVAGFSRYAHEGGPIKTEEDPLDATPPKLFRNSAAAMAYLEQAVTDFGGIALRYGAFYGAANDGTIEPIRKRQFPIVGDGDGIWSWIHLDDAAAATVLALEHDGPAI